MDNQNQPLDADLGAGSGPAQGLQVTPAIRQYWQETSRWALFFALLGFLYLAFIVISILWAGAKSPALLGGVFSVFLVGALVFFPVWYIFQFAQKLRSALQTDDTAAAEESFTNLRRFYQFVGVLTIIVLALYAITLLFTLVFVGRSL